MANRRKPDNLKKRITGISIDTDTKLKAKEIGNGNLSLGVRRAVDLIHKRLQRKELAEGGYILPLE